MSTFAHVFSNTVFDPQPAPDTTTYKSFFGTLPTTLWASHVFKQVTDGTLHGAIDNGDGTFTNPTIAAVHNPLVLSWSDFSNYLIGLLGGGDAGTEALQALLDTCATRTVSVANDKLVRYFYTWFVGQTSFTKTDTNARLVSLVTASIITQNQANAVANNWPST